MGSLSANLQRFGMERIAKVESLQEIIAEMTDDDGTGANLNPDQSITTADPENDG